MEPFVRIFDEDVSAKPSPFKMLPKTVSTGNSEGESRDVFVYLNIFSIGDIDTVACTFKADFHITATWISTQQRTELHKLSHEQLPVAVRAEFDAQLVFMNCVDVVERLEERFDIVSWRTGHAGEPACSYKCRCKGVFREPLELSRFPFDQQPLNIVVSSHSKAVTLYEDPDAPSRLRTEFMSSPEFVLQRIDFFASRAHLGYPLLYVAVIAQRRPGYYVWNVFLPTLLLTLIAAPTVFTIPVSDTNSRLGNVLTLVLTSVAFKFVVSQSLPKIPYNTCLDWYVLSSFIMLMLVVVENVVVASVAAHDASLAASIERWLLAAVALLLVLGHCCLAATIWRWQRVVYQAGPSRISE
jgi:hypothetical protein